MTMAGRSMSMKRRRTKNKKLMVPSIYSLPDELVKEVLARVAASSFTDFFSAKLSCKVFHEVADDKDVIQRVSLERIQVLLWRKSENAASFLTRCKESGNPEALYRQGVEDFVSYMRLESALESLEKAAKCCHIGAIYALGIILLLSGDEFKQRGMELLSGMNKSKVMRKECRENLKAVMRGIWIRNSLIQRPTCCRMSNEHQKRRTWWPEDYPQCKACMCDEEVTSIFYVLPRQFFN